MQPSGKTQEDGKVLNLVSELPIPRTAMSSTVKIVNRDVTVHSAVIRMRDFAGHLAAPAHEPRAKAQAGVNTDGRREARLRRTCTTLQAMHVQSASAHKQTHTHRNM